MDGAQEKVLAVFPVDKAMQQHGPLWVSGLCPMVFVPCIWPALLLASPCNAVAYKNTKQTLENLFYAVTSAGVYEFHRDAPTDACQPCLSPATGTVKLTWVCCSCHF